MSATKSRYPTWLMKFVAPPQSADDEAAGSRREIAKDKEERLHNGHADDKTFTMRMDDHDVEKGNREQRDNMGLTSRQQPAPVRRQPEPLTQEQRDKNDTQLLIKMGRRLFTEFLGTFMLVYFVAVASVEFNLRNNDVDRKGAALNQTGAGLSGGFTLAFLIWSMGHISGAHFNCVVTWAFALRGMFPVHWVIPYWIVQFLGSLVAGAFVRAFYYDAAGFGSNAVAPQYLAVTGMFYEAVLTFIFVFTVLSLATKGGNVGPQAALADGFALAVCIMLGHSYTGTSVNPFRSLGPGIINGPRDELWVFVAGPFIGATCSVLAVWIMNGPLKKSDLNAAQGKGEPEDN